MNLASMSVSACSLISDIGNAQSNITAWLPHALLAITLSERLQVC
jgi:hypothetical protein